MTLFIHLQLHIEQVRYDAQEQKSPPTNESQLFVCNKTHLIQYLVL